MRLTVHPFIEYEKALNKMTSKSKKQCLQQPENILFPAGR
jgi:hypothetical protein